MINDSKQSAVRNEPIFEENKLPPRAYFVPNGCLAEVKKSGNLFDRQLSKSFVSLCGEWEFAYFASALDFESGKPDDCKFDKIEVPSCWQFTGYEKPFYVNIDYPFPFDPPFVPTDTPCGVYRKNFTVTELSAHTIIHFSGVGSCLKLYVNGCFRGYSEGSHNTAEFDLTDFLHLGENSLTAVVYKWCAGSYLEDQDFFRCNGIFREVYLLRLNASYLFDAVIATEKTSEWRVTAKPVIIGAENCSVEMSLEFEGARVGELQRDGEIYSLVVPSAKIWTDETPNLYTLYIRLFDRESGAEIEASSFDVGFKEVKIEDKKLLWCGKPIKLKGVNHHDTDPEHGWVMSLEKLERDVALMKEFNVNCVRTSHYPPDERFILLCNRMGVYVVLEADIECHGARNTAFGADCLSEDPVWEKMYLDRVNRMYKRDSNNPCIIMYSLGNESGGIRNQDKCCKLIKSYDKNAVVHYEGAIVKERLGYDVVSMMYPNPAECEKHATSANDMPFFMCEYAHAMGVGPGGLQAYWDIVYKYDSFVGGCIWEWADQAVLTEKGYLYGGDNGEYVSDGNFCCDGLFLPDRTPYTSAFEMKKVYSPLKSRLIGKNPLKIEVVSKKYFVKTDCTVVWSIKENGITAQSGKANIAIEPQGSAVFSLDVPFDLSKECALDLCYYCGSEKIAFDQLFIGGAFSRASVCGKATFTETERFLTAQKGDNKIVFDKLRGTLCSVESHGKQLLAAEHNCGKTNAFQRGTMGFYPSIWRAPTDNDMYMKSAWLNAKYDKMWFSVKSVDVKKIEKGYLIAVSGGFAPPSRGKYFDCDITYTVLDNLQVSVEAELSPCQKDLPHLPKFALDIVLAECVDEVEYYGLGERESYPDFRTCATLGIYKRGVDEFHDFYIRPQECGNRSEVRFAKITDGDGCGLVFDMDKKPFGFNVYRNSDEEITRAKHSFELKPDNFTRVSINGFMCGLGSQSCGQEPLDEYKIFPDKKLKFSFVFTVV